MDAEQSWMPACEDELSRAEDSRMEDDLDGAKAHYEKALALIPEPREESVNATVAWVGIGEVQFLKRDFPAALVSFQHAVRSKGGLGDPQIHLRLGQLQFEAGDMTRAEDELMRAYMGSGDIIFEGQDPKYRALIQPIIDRTGSGN